MNALIKDLRYGLRVLTKSPGSTLVAVAALGLGIGANSAIFSVVNAVLLRPLQYKDPEHLVVVWETKLNKGIQQEYVSPPDYRDWKEQNRVFDQIAALGPITYGPGQRAAAGPAAPRGLRLDVTG